MSSPIDGIFEEIFGDKPVKSGTALEKLAAIVMHIMNGGDVKHDDKIRGEFSKTLYQLDVHHVSEGLSTMGETKDYTIQNKKVGRGELQKLAGALPDLKEIDQGVFFSATGFTKPAKKYAEEAEKITGKPIILLGLRPSTETDEKGFIKTIVLKMHFVIPLPHMAKLIPHITPRGQAALKSLLKNGETEIKYELKLKSFYNESGDEILSLHQLTSKGYGEIHSETEKSHACFYLPNHFIIINGVLSEIYGLEYEIPHDHDIREIRISDDSKNRFVILDKDGIEVKIVTDNMLREYEFDEAGNLKKR